MKVEKAIEILTLDINSPGSVAIEDVNDAEQLGIEALKLVMDKRGYPEYIIPRLLPGETEE